MAELTPQILTRAEAATLLRCDTRTIDRLRVAGKLPALAFGARVRFRRDAVESLLRARA